MVEGWTKYSGRVRTHTHKANADLMHILESMLSEAQVKRGMKCFTANGDASNLVMRGVRAEKCDTYQATFRDYAPLVSQLYILILKDRPTTGTHPVAHTPWMNQRK